MFDSEVLTEPLYIGVQILSSLPELSHEDEVLWRTGYRALNRTYVSLDTTKG